MEKKIHKPRRRINMVGGKGSTSRIVGEYDEGSVMVVFLSERAGSMGRRKKGLFTL